MNCVSHKKKLRLQALLVGGVVTFAALGANAAVKHVTPPPTDNSANVVDPSSTAVAPDAAPFKEYPDTFIAAEVNGVKIPMKDINEAISGIKQEEPSLADGSAAANAELTKFRQSMLHDLVDFQLLLQEAKNRNIVPDSKTVDAALWQIKAKFPSPEVYNQWLTSTGQTGVELRENIVNNMTVQELGDKLGVDVTVSDDDMLKFYNDNKANFVVPDSVVVNHILIAVPQGASDADKKTLKIKAERVLKEALKSDADFSALAAKYSDDPTSAKNGGSLGALVEVDKGSWKPVVDAAFAATPGKVIPKLITSDFGYHIVDPVEKKPGRLLPFDDDMRKQIKPIVLHQKVEVIVDLEIQKLRKTNTIKTFI